jgi:hypothetical protein
MRRGGEGAGGAAAASEGASLLRGSRAHTRDAWSADAECRAVENNLAHTHAQKIRRAKVSGKCEVFPSGWDGGRDSDDYYQPPH